MHMGEKKESFPSLRRFNNLFDADVIYEAAD